MAGRRPRARARRRPAADRQGRPPRNERRERRAALEQQRLHALARERGELLVERTARAELELGAPRAAGHGRTRAGAAGGRRRRPWRRGAAHPRAPCPSPPRRRRPRHAARGRAGALPRRSPTVGPGTTTRPSSVTASLSITNGRPCTTHVRQASFWRSRLRRSSSSTSIPAARSARRAAARSGLGSSAPTTTRAMPAATIASTHGGVRAVVSARLERHVERRAARALRRPRRAPRSRRAASPARSCHTLAGDRAVCRDDDGADGRVRVASCRGALAELERALEAHRAGGDEPPVRVRGGSGSAEDGAARDEQRRAGVPHAARRCPPRSPPSTWIGTSTSEASSRDPIERLGHERLAGVAGVDAHAEDEVRARLARRGRRLARGCLRVERDADREPVRPRALGHGTRLVASPRRGTSRSRPPTPQTPRGGARGRRPSDGSRARRPAAWIAGAIERRTTGPIVTGGTK